MIHGNMATESQVSPGEETQNTAPEVVEQTTEVTTPKTVETKTDENPEEDETQKSIKRLQRRIDKRTADVYRERARAEQLAAELEQLRSKQVPDEQPNEHAKEDIEKLVELKAEAKEFAKVAERIVQSGKKAEPDFVNKLNDLRSEVGDFVQPNGLPSPFMKAVLDVCEDNGSQPEKLMLHLAKNPDVAADLADLPVIKLAARLDRIERGLSEPQPKQSSAPKPLEPVKPKPISSLEPSDNDSITDWVKKERARLAAKRG
jgi:hypothetical protein